MSEYIVLKYVVFSYLIINQVLGLDCKGMSL